MTTHKTNKLIFKEIRLLEIFIEGKNLLFLLPLIINGFLQTKSADILQALLQEKEQIILGDNQHGQLNQLRKKIFPSVSRNPQGRDQMAKHFLQLPKELFLLIETFL